MRMLPLLCERHVREIAQSAFGQLRTGFTPTDPAPVRDITSGRELTAALETNDQVSQALWFGQIEVRHELATDFAKNRNVAAHGRQSTLHGFYQWQAEAFHKRRKHQ
ncbi:hypothetical protein D3C71_1939670 [compost metagenome]